MRKAGYLETIVEGETGVFFDRAEYQPTSPALSGSRMSKVVITTTKDHAHQFSEPSFTVGMRRAVSEVPEQDFARR